MSHQVTLYFMRHGEIADTKLLAGKTDLTLSAKGICQMQDATTDIAVSHCITSPLTRCLGFAENFCAQQHLPMHIEPAIQECDFGDWDGKPFDDLWSLPKPNIGDFWQNPMQVTPPNGEPFVKFQQRVVHWWHEFLSHLTDQDDQTLIVTHAGVIKVLLAAILTHDNAASVVDKLSIGYASIVKVTVFIEGDQRWSSLNL